MKFGITKYSPLDVDTLLAGKKRTLSPNEKADYYITFADTEGFKSTHCIIFNSLEYLKKRSDITILDEGNITISQVVEKIKVVYK
jgi:hypothetical protein